MGEGDGVKEEERMVTTEEAMEKVIGQLDHVIETVEAENEIAPEAKTTKEVEILPGFPSKVAGELLFADADNINVREKFPLLYPHPLQLRDTFCSVYSVTHSWEISRNSKSTIERYKLIQDS